MDLRAIPFILTLVAQVIVGTCVLAYAAHCFLTVVQDTAAGNDEVRWPDEPMYDWLWKFPYLAWLVGVWMLPAVLLLRLANPPSPAVTPGLWFAVVVVFVLWLFFPVSLLSSLSASSRWHVLTRAVFPRMAKQAPAVLFFYGVSGLLLIVAGALFYAATALGSLLALPVAAAVGSTVFFVYARLLGRVAWLMGKVRVPLPKPARKGKKRRPDPAREPEPPVAPSRQRTPIPTPDGLVHGYDLSEEAPRRQSAPAEEDEDEPRLGREPVMTPDGPVDGYDMSEAPEPPPSDLENAAKQMTRDLAAKVEQALQAPRDQAPPPRRPLVQGVFTFPWYPTTMGHWLLVGLGLLVEGFMLQLLIQMYPG